MKMITPLPTKAHLTPIVLFAQRNSEETIVNVSIKEIASAFISKAMNYERMKSVSIDQ